jgi:predicted anti-sigma-YlaC factor YlaD
VTTHTQYTEVMSLLLDGEAAPGEQAALRKHLLECPDCSVVWAAWQMLDADFSEEPMVVPRPGLALRVAARLEERSRWRTWTRWLGISLLIAWLGVAALVSLFAVTAFWWGVTHPFQAGTVLSAGAHVFSAILWPVRSVETTFAAAGLSIWTGIGGYLVVTGVLLGVWLWLAARRPAYAAVRVP